MRFVAIALTAALLSGCAITEDKILVRYTAPAYISVADGASAVTLQIVSVDGRVANRDRVATKKNGYGMEMAKIVASNDVVREVGDAVQAELSSLGFKIGPGQLLITVETTDFYNDFKPGLFSADAVAQVSFNLSAKTAKGDLLYSRVYKAVGFNNGVAIMGGSQALVALQAALRDAVQQMVTDGDLHRALVKGGRAQQAQATPTS